jgi:uncharacterized protein YbcC (UPF0753/DUF2309 family)
MTTQAHHKIPQDAFLASTGFDLDNAIDTMAHWLPAQGPIKDFIHHNTLHAVQHYPFHKGVAVAAKVFGARSYLPLADYQALHRQGRIKDFAINWAIEHSGCSHKGAETLRERLFIVDDSAHYPPISLANHGIRTNWLTHLEVDLNSLVHPLMFRLLSNFLDQGISRWTMPKAGESFWACVRRLAQNSLLPLYPFNGAGVRDLLDQSPDAVILACLQKIVGAEERLYEQYLLEMLLAHPGWSGMVRLIELDPKILLERRNISLKELIAVELVAELAIIRHKRGVDFTTVTQLPNWDEIPLLSDYEDAVAVSMRLQVWQEAMEFSLHTELLAALQARPEPPAVTPAPIAQALFCIDDRECSVRRYLEASNPAIETFGAAGFFGIDFFYQGFDDAYPVAQCPNVVVPKHIVLESDLRDEPQKPSVSDGFSALHLKPHSLFRGWLYTQVVGVGYAVRMVWDVFRPGSHLLKIEKLSEVDAHTQLHLLRESDEPNADGQLLGFSLLEMADKIEGLLRNIGLTQNFAPLVVVVAHGSSSVNNPHFAAYNCGACSGKPGAPNARAFAWMANNDGVRTLLSERGIVIPASTYFVPALRNTSRDEITYLDKHLYENRNLATLPAFQHAMQDALEKNAQERCRWFELGPQSPAGAHEHVVTRASSIFEPRPELNHSNNLYSIVGRRALTRDLFLDRRAFLHSYEPDSDPDGALLVKILSAVIPVCGGINLEYLFSRMDNSIYGAGTKLPHNVIGLLGVANGVEGDLRTGLPSQMIEVHEPARLLIVVEQSTDVIDCTLAKLGALKEWLDNAWVRLVSCHPVTRELAYYFSGGWEAVDLPANCPPPVADCSEAIVAGKTTTIPVHLLRRSV